MIMFREEVLVGYGCPECKSLHVEYDDVVGDYYCFNCGLVLRACYYQHGVVFPGLWPIYK